MTNINKTNNHLSPELTEHKKNHDLWRWKSRHRADTNSCEVKPVNGIPAIPSWERDI